jgi:DNA replication protein DnaC
MGKDTLFAEFLFETKSHKSILELKEKGTTDPWINKMIRANIPKEFWNLDIGCFDPKTSTEEQLEAVRVVKLYCRKIDVAKQNGFGFLFKGPNGVGKTTLQMVILKNALRKGHSAFYISMPVIFRQIYLGFKYPEILAELHRILFDTDFLAVGECGKDYHRREASQFAIAEFDTIFRTRREKCLATSLDTNLSLDTLNEIYGDSIMSLFASRLKIVNIIGNDFRRVSQQKQWSKYLGD